MVKAIVGANWGDEGKGKITDVLANDSDIVIRFQGGANDIQLSTITENLLFTSFLRVFFIRISPI